MYKYADNSLFNNSIMQAISDASSAVLGTGIRAAEGIPLFGRVIHTPNPLTEHFSEQIAGDKLQTHMDNTPESEFDLNDGLLYGLGLGVPTVAMFLLADRIQKSQGPESE